MNTTPWQKWLNCYSENLLSSWSSNDAAWNAAGVVRQRDPDVEGGLSETRLNHRGTVTHHGRCAAVTGTTIHAGCNALSTLSAASQTHQSLLNNNCHHTQCIRYMQLFFSVRRPCSVHWHVTAPYKLSYYYYYYYYWQIAINHNDYYFNYLLLLLLPLLQNNNYYYNYFRFLFHWTTFSELLHVHMLDARPVI